MARVAKDGVAIARANRRATLARLRANRKLSPEELLERHNRFLEFVLELKRAAKRS